MATSDYWDYSRWNSTSGTYRATGTSGTTSTTSSSCYWRWRGYVTPVLRKILVTSPKNWTSDQVLKFVELVNHKTNTGWIVRMVIYGGQILITDPDVEKRNLIDFIPLLKEGASKSDIKLINEFLDLNPCL